LPVTTSVGSKIDDDRLLPDVEASTVVLAMQDRIL
jgi:hypothetical protein